MSETRRDAGPMLTATRLFEKRSAAGNVYFTGRMGGLRVLVLKSRETAADGDSALGEMIKRQRETVGLNRGASAGGTKDGPRGSFTDPRDNSPTLAEAGIDAAQRLRLLASGWASSLRMADLPAGGRCASAGIWRAWADWCTP